MAAFDFSADANLHLHRISDDTFWQRLSQFPNQTYLDNHSEKKNDFTEIFIWLNM